MEWEDLGYQNLVHAGKGGLFGGSAKMSIPMWRTPVPGGWLIMTLIQGTATHTTTTSFYPDPEHIWDPHSKYEASYLLRAVESETASEH